MVARSPVGKVVTVGECMLELRADGAHWAIGHAGDVFNTSVYLARLGEEVAFLTALGDDPFSSTMRTAWREEGFDMAFVLTAADALPGLYAIDNDASGERVFHYWREQAAVRKLFRLPGIAAILAQAAHARLLYLSGITLALFDAAGRNALAQLAHQVRADGGIIAFDPNYRAKLWPSPEDGRRALAEFAPLATIALPTFDDEAALHGDTDPGAVLARWHDAGVQEVVIKLGAAGCMIGNGRIIAPRQPLVPTDTTGAGDAFNAGYLAARRRGLDTMQAAMMGNALGGLVIAQRGAIIPRAAVPDFATLLAMSGAGTGAGAAA